MNITWSSNLLNLNPFITRHSSHDFYDLPDLRKTSVYRCRHFPHVLPLSNIIANVFLIRRKLTRKRGIVGMLIAEEFKNS